LELIANGENSEIEFKRDDIRPEQLARELVAFSNSFGGRVLIGIENDGKVSGIQRRNLEEWVMDTVCGNYIHPFIIPKYEEVQWDEQKRIAIVSVLMGTSKPYVLRHNGREEIYIRIGSITKRATREQIVRLSASGGLIHVECMQVSGTGFKHLGLVRLENYFRDILSEPALPESQEEWELRLEDMGFMTRSAGQGNVCTIAGLVLFGIYPRRYLRQAGIRIEVYDSSDKKYKALLDLVLDGPMLGRWEVGKRGISSIIDDGLVEKVSSIIYPFITEESNTIDNGFRRGIKRLYPWESIRELILNALAHRDWTRNTDIEICRYNDRIEIISPGALPNSMTVEKMIGGRRSPRNNIIMEVLRDYQYVDARDMGIRTKVIPIMHEFNGTKPLFEATDDHLKTVLYCTGAISDPNNDPDDPKKKGNDPKTDPDQNIENLILGLIRQNPKISYDDLSSSLEKSRATIKRAIQKLKEAGSLKRIGSNRGGKWELRGIEGGALRNVKLKM
jgi:ATP-dependent DNA helicase RecG